MYFVYAFMILLMYFLAGINKVRNFSGTVAGFKNMFFLKKLPNVFYQLAIFLVIFGNFSYYSYVTIYFEFKHITCFFI